MPVGLSSSKASIRQGSGDDKELLAKPAWTHGAAVAGVRSSIRRFPFIA